MRLTRFLMILGVAAATLFASVAGGATVRLSDGRVLEGEIIRETDSFLYVRVMIGGVAKDELVLRSNIESIDRDKPETTEKPRKPDFEEDELNGGDDADRPRDGSVRVAFITLEEMVGPYMFAPALSDAVDELEGEGVDIVILRINSGGGALIEIRPLMDVIEDEIKSEYRVAAWIESAISAAAMTASICEEIYFKSEGNLGAATGFRQTGSGAQSMQGRELEEVLAMMEEVSRRGQKDPLIMRAMQVPTNLSCDFASDGSVIWRNDLEGEHIVSTEEDILTFDSQTAIKYKYAQAVADTKDELMRAMGVSDWVEAGEEADEVMVRHREEVARGTAQVGKIWQFFQIAANDGDWTRARRYLGQLKAWGQRNAAFAKYGAGGSPPLNEDVFREIERQIDRELRRQRTQDRSRR